MKNKLPEKDGWYWWHRKCGTTMVQVCDNGDSVQFFGEAGDTRESFNEFVGRHWAQSTFAPVLQKEEILAALRKKQWEESPFIPDWNHGFNRGIRIAMHIIKRLSTVGGDDGR